MRPDFAYSLKNVDIFIYGNQTRINDDPSISYNQALALGGHRGKIAQLIVASDETRPGHKLVCPAKHDDLMFADGAVVREPGECIIMQTADCYTGILWHESGIAAYHGGRSALSPSGHCASCTVVENAVHALVGNSEATSIEALLVGGICGGCFKHDRQSAQHLVEPFLKYPPQVFVDRETGSLDLYEVMRHQLVHRGVLPEHIRREGVCTFETPHLASHRRDKTLRRNTTIVVVR